MDGCSNQLDLLAMEVRMLRRELARYPITSYKVTAYSIVAAPLMIHTVP